MGLEKKMIYRLRKTKYMVINMGKESEKVYNRRKSKRRNSSRNRYLQVPGKGKQQIRKLERSYTRIKYKM